MHEVIGSIMAIHSHGITFIIKFIHDTSFFTDEQLLTMFKINPLPQASQMISSP